MVPLNVRCGFALTVTNKVDKTGRANSMNLCLASMYSLAMASAGIGVPGTLCGVCGAHDGGLPRAVVRHVCAREVLTEDGV